MKISHVLLLAFVALTTSACSNTPIRHIPEYSSALNKHPEILVLPPESVVNSIEASGGKKRMYDYEYNMEPIITEQLVAALQAKGLRTKVLDRRSIHDQGLNEEVAQFRHVYGTERDKLYIQPLLEEKKAFAISNSVNQSAAQIASKTGNDLLIVTDYTRSIKSGGARAQAVAVNILMIGLTARSMPSDPDDIATMTVGIVEASTGRILWTNRQSDMRGMFSSSADKKQEAKEMKGLVSGILKPLKTSEK